MVHPSASPNVDDVSLVAHAKHDTKRRVLITTPSNHQLIYCVMESLAFFECQVHGVKFNDLREAGAKWSTSLPIVKEPTNTHNLFCAAAWVPGSPTSRSLVLGHVAKEAARWLNQLLQPPYRVTRFIILVHIGSNSPGWYKNLCTCKYM